MRYEGRGQGYTAVHPETRKEHEALRRAFPWLGAFMYVVVAGDGGEAFKRMLASDPFMEEAP